MSHVLRQRITIIALLLLMFGVRAYQPNLQDAYIDEGFHLRRAATIYDFEQNPAREAHGKLLLYFWLGLFVSDDAATSLPAGRLSIALFSVISGATIYLLGRMFANHRAGRLALLIYALMPLSVFYERMALADPLASGLMMLVLWRSYVFARNPSYRQGVLLGILIALASLAKLTMLLAVFFPLIAAIIYNKKKQNIAQFIRLYIPPLVLSGAIFCLMWSPFIIPAYFARNSDSPYILVNSRNIVRNESDPSSIPDYLQRLMPVLVILCWMTIVCVSLVVWAIQSQYPKLFIFKSFGSSSDYGFWRFHLVHAIIFMLFVGLSLLPFCSLLYLALSALAILCQLPRLLRS